VNSNVLAVILVLGFAVAGSVILFAVAVRLIRRAAGISPRKKMLRFGLAGILAAPFLFIALEVAWFTVDNFPFTSGIIAHEVAPNGDEICIVQTFKDAEPYQVSLYARRAGQPWHWNYLAHQDNRWRNCRTEFDGNSLRVFTSSTLRTTFSFEDAITVHARSAADSDYQLPAEFTPQQILAWHNKKFGW
jgi:hypothetical protein